MRQKLGATRLPYRRATLSSSSMSRAAIVFTDVSAISRYVSWSSLNIASYALLLHMVAFICDLAPGEFIHTIGDAHIYLDAVDQVKEQINREPLPLPTLEIVDRGQTSIDDFVLSDFKLQNYESMPAIKAKMAV